MLVWFCRDCVGFCNKTTLSIFRIVVTHIGASLQTTVALPVEIAPPHRYTTRNASLTNNGEPPHTMNTQNTRLGRLQRLELIVVPVLVVVVIAVFVAASALQNNTAADTTAPYAEAQILMGSSHLTPDENRQTFLIRDGFERFDNVAAVDVTVRSVEGDSAAWQGAATPYADGDGTYWVAYPDFPAPGDYLFAVRVMLDNNDTFQRTLTATVHPAPIGVAVGEAAPAVSSFTLAMQDRPERITTDLTPNDAFYQMTVADAVTSGRPSVIVFGTPELCTRKLWNLCGATLDDFDAMAAELADRVNFVHVEIYNLDTGKYVEAWNRYGLEVSPWIYVIDGDGVVNYRYDAIVGAEELRPRLVTLLSTGG